MKVVCGWCKLDMGSKPPLSSNEETTSICIDCHKKEMDALDHLRKNSGMDLRIQKAKDARDS